MKINLKIVSLIALLCFCIILPLFFIFSQSSSNSETTLVTIGTERVSLSEYMIYLYSRQLFYEEVGGDDIWETDFGGGVSALVSAKNAALTTLLHVKIANRHAQEIGVRLTDEEIAAAKTEAAVFYSELNPSVIESIEADLPLIEKIMTETVLYQKIYDDTVKGFELSEADFEKAYEEYAQDFWEDELTPEFKESYRQDYTNQKRYEIFVNDYENWVSKVKVITNEPMFNGIGLIE